MTLRKGCFIAREAMDACDIERARELRQSRFDLSHSDHDPYDDHCTHVVIEDARSGALVGTFRYAVMFGENLAQQAYSAQFYGLDKIAQHASKVLEIGRFCMTSDVLDTDILRVAWGALTKVVDAENIDHMVGCSSFDGIDPTPYVPALSLLAKRHLAQAQIAATPKAAEIIAYGAALAGRDVDARGAMHSMPPLLKTYLGMGGRVSDHAVVDRDMKTFHVFTSVEIAKIPPARARALRAVAYGTA